MAHRVHMTEQFQAQPTQAQSDFPPPPRPPAPPFVMDFMPSTYIGFHLKPGCLPTGKSSWSQIVTQPMTENQTQLANIVKKDSSKNKPEEVLKSAQLNQTKKQHIYGILNHQNALIANSNMMWKLVSIQVDHDKNKTYKTTAKTVTIEVLVTSIRIILEAVPQPVPGVVRQSTSSFGQQGQLLFPIGASHIPLPAVPIIHQDPGQHGNRGALFGEYGHAPGQVPSHESPLPPEMTKLPSGGEVLDDDDYDDDDHEQHHKTHKKEGKNKKAKPSDIYIPETPIREHRHSKNSSRPTSWGSSNSAALESPMTSVSGSPSEKNWQDLKHSSKHYKRYHGRRSSLDVHVNDSFVVTPNQSHHNGHKHRSSMNELSRNSSRYRREPGNYDLSGELQRLRLDEEDRKFQEYQQLKHQRDVNERLDRIENNIGNIGNIIHQGNRDLVPQDRPVYDRSYSDRYEIGYSGSQPLRNRSYSSGYDSTSRRRHIPGYHTYHYP